MKRKSERKGMSAPTTAPGLGSGKGCRISGKCARSIWNEDNEPTLEGLEKKEIAAGVEGSVSSDRVDRHSWREISSKGTT